MQGWIQSPNINPKHRVGYSPKILLRAVLWGCGVSWCPQKQDAPWEILGETLWRSTVRKHLRETLWGNTLEKHSGEKLWGTTVGKPSEETLWRNTVGKHCGETLWDNTVGKHCWGNIVWTHCMETLWTWSFKNIENSPRFQDLIFLQGYLNLIMSININAPIKRFWNLHYWNCLAWHYIMLGELR